MPESERFFTVEPARLIAKGGERLHASGGEPLFSFSINDVTNVIHQVEESSNANMESVREFVYSNEDLVLSGLEGYIDPNTIDTMKVIYETFESFKEFIEYKDLIHQVFEILATIARHL